MRFRSIAVFLLAFAVAAGALRMRRGSSPLEVGEREQGIVLAPTTERAPPPSAPASPLAPAEVQPALDRVFDQALAVDPASSPAFVAGDFNGDDAVDLAVAVRPRNADVLPTLNSALAVCGVQDAGATPAAGRPSPVAAGERLLAVIHGVDPGGWRNPDARQCHLVKNAAGSGLRPRSLSGLPDAIRMRVNRTHAGDVLSVTRGGVPGVIFWTGAAYVWAGEAPARPR